MSGEYITLGYNGPYSIMSTARFDQSISINNGVEMVFRNIALPGFTFDQVDSATDSKRLDDPKEAFCSS